MARIKLTEKERSFIINSTVRAKFKCTSIELHEGGNKRAKLQAIYGTEDENKDFTRYTPSGELSILISPDTAANQYFNPGDEFYLDFTKVEKD